MKSGNCKPATNCASGQKEFIVQMATSSTGSRPAETLTIDLRNVLRLTRNDETVEVSPKYACRWLATICQRTDVGETTEGEGQARFFQHLASCLINTVVEFGATADVLNLLESADDSEALDALCNQAIRHWFNTAKAGGRVVEK